MFDVQGITLQTPAQQAFAYIAARTNLPHWTSALGRSLDVVGVVRKAR